MKSQREVLERQISILKSVFLWHEGKVLSEAQAEELIQWTGWGYCKVLLMDPYNYSEWVTASEVDRGLQPLVMQLHELLKEKLAEKSYKEVISSIKESVLSSFYTPKVITDTFMQVINEYADIQSIMDPSAGGGVFALSAMNHLPNLEKVTVYEKDMLTAKVLDCIMDAVPGDRGAITVYNKPFEESDSREDGKYCMVATNPPYGNYPVYDPLCTDKNISGKVHNYFVWKGLQKLKDGGIMAYLITNAFLDSPSNKSARKYLYSNADHISVIVMPDNLMKESANTEAPSHLIVVKRRYGKAEADMSDDEKLLCESTMQQVQADGTGKKMVAIARNSYIDKYGGDIVIGEQTVGKNQYGKPSIETWWNDTIDKIATPFSEMLHRDLSMYYGPKKVITVYDEDPNWVEPAGLASAYTGQGEEIPLGQLEITEPGKFKWTDESEGTERTIDNPGIRYTRANGTILKEGEMIWDDQIVDIPEDEDPISDEEDVQVLREKMLENATDPRIIGHLQQLMDISATPIKEGTLITVRMGQKDLYTQQTELVTVQKVKENGEVVGVPLEGKKGDQEKLKMYVEIRDTYMSLQQEEQKQLNQ